MKQLASHYLVEELINGEHPKGNRLLKGHLEDLLSKFIKLDTNGITNCDLQSGNKFLTDENKTKLIDFGSYNYVFIKVLFKKQIHKIEEMAPNVIKDSTNNIQDNLKNSNKKLGIVVSIIAAVALGIIALVVKKKKNASIQQNNVELNNNKAISQNHNTALLKNLPNAFKQF